MRTLLVYGDSNTHGTPPMTSVEDTRRLPPKDRWPHVMAAALEGWDVQAEGLPARTTVHDDPTEGAYRNGRRVLAAMLHSHKPLGGVILLLGTNDLQPRYGVTALEIARSVERLALDVRASGLTDNVAIFAPPPVREVGTFAETYAGAEARQVGLAGHMAARAEANGLPFLDLSRFGAVSEIDGVHWTAETHHAIGAAAAEFVREVWP